MGRLSAVLRVGTRGSRLSLKQTADALDRIRSCLPELDFTTVEFSSPGDRDRSADLRGSADDFFTRDIDNALLSGEIDFAIHSAKDIPEPPPEGTDWFWLPWREDPRDVIVLRRGECIDGLVGEGKSGARVGVSSTRRELYCRKRFPGSLPMSIRGDIEMRLSQLDEGKFDIVVMAAAGLLRLGLGDRICEYIPVVDLPTPEGQGCLGIVFRKEDRILRIMRRLFVRPVVFAGAGPGGPEMLTIGAADAIRKCDVCLYDALVSQEILKLLPIGARSEFVGKRLMREACSQEEINRRMADFARRGKAVVRLKGGDPGIFGRLAEEILHLESLSLPYRVIPGVSSISAATTGTGLLLTRRGISRGFTALTLRRAASGEIAEEPVEDRFPRVFLMGINELPEIRRYLSGRGVLDEEKVSVVLDAGLPSQKIISCDLRGLDSPELLSGHDTGLPGIVLVGKIADGRYLYRQGGALEGRRILLVFSEAAMEDAADATRKYCGIPVPFEMISLTPLPLGKCGNGGISGFDWMTVGSPSSAEILISQMKKEGIDLRSLPKILACGKATAAKFIDAGIFPDAIPEQSFSAEGMLEAARRRISPEARILVLRSDKAGGSFAESLRSAGFTSVEEFVLYQNVPVQRKKCPEFDAAVFGSASAVEEFIRGFGAGTLEGKPVSAVGPKTFEALKRQGCRTALSPIGIESAESAVFAIAASAIRRDLLDGLFCGNDGFDASDDYFSAGGNGTRRE